REGVFLRSQLAWLYLSEWRPKPALGRAEAFFKKELGSAIPQYKMVARVGQAALAAFEGKAAQSNELFQEVLHESGKGRFGFQLQILIRQDRYLRELIAAALQRNAEQGKLPDELQKLLEETQESRPPPAATRPAGQPPRN